MPRTTRRRLTLLTLAACTIICGVVGLTAGTAWAHNTLLTTDPADGAVLSTAPTQITWVFSKEVPLETMTVTLIDATGIRSELTGSTHSAAGNMEVVTPLPPLPPGAISLRWRLVGPDGHPISGRVDFALSSPAPRAVVTSVPTVAATTPPTNPGVDELSEQGDGYSAPTMVRWVLRYASYMAIMAIAGILLTSVFVWPAAGNHPLLRRILGRALFVTAALGFLQLLIVASDVSGKGPWASFGSITAATTTDTGMALALRIALAASMWLVIFRARIVHSEVYWTAATLAGVGLLATWAFAGHSRSMRWPAMGVVTDVAHHAAAAAWIAGLAIVGWIVIAKEESNRMAAAVRSFSHVAAISVGVLIATGAVQTVRLVGNPADLFEVNHGRFLAAKLGLLAIMLGIASTNRRRLEQRLNDPAGAGRHVGDLRRGILAEFAIGLVIVAVTAAMVVSPPSPTTGAPTRVESTPILHTVVVDTERLP